MHNLVSSEMISFCGVFIKADDMQTLNLFISRPFILSLVLDVIFLIVCSPVPQQMFVLQPFRHVILVSFHMKRETRL
jgi:hypothetical protein